MEKKRDSRPANYSPCRRILNAITTSCPVVRAIRRRVLSPPSPTMSRNLTITLVENEKAEKVGEVKVRDNSDDDHVSIIKSAKIAPASHEPAVLPADRNPELEKTKTKGTIITRQSSGQVPVAPKKTETEPPKPGLNNGEKKSTPVQNQEGTNQKARAGDHIENCFSDYIERAKVKLRTVSNVGSSGTKGESGTEKRDSAGKTDEHFTNYINKAKMKLRTTSSIGGGRDVVSSKHGPL